MVIVWILVGIVAWLVIGAVTLKSIMLYQHVSTIDQMHEQVSSRPGSHASRSDTNFLCTLVVIAWPAFFALVPILKVAKLVKWFVNLDHETIRMKQAEWKTKRIEKNLTRVNKAHD